MKMSEAAQTTSVQAVTQTVTDPAQIEDFNRGPITPVATFPSSCLATPTAYGAFLPNYIGHLLDLYYDPSCYPPSSSSVASTDTSVWNVYYYSPAISCPSGWTLAATISSSFGGWATSDTTLFLSLGSETTAVLCCPDGFTSLNGGINHQCASSYPRNGPSTVLTYFVNTTNVNGAEILVPETFTLSKSDYPDQEWDLYADGIPIWYQASDLAAAAGTTGGSSPSSSTSNLGPTSTGGTPTSSPSSSGLSTGAKAGIGVGVALGVLLLAAIAGVFVFTRRQRYRAVATEQPATTELGNVEQKAPPGVPAYPMCGGVVEADATQTQVPVRQELDGGAAPEHEVHEMY